MLKLVDLVAPRGMGDLLLKSFLLVAVFTLFDGWISYETSVFVAGNQLRTSLVTFLIDAPFGLFVMSIMASQYQL